MRQAWIRRIRERIDFRQYDMTAHAAQEMAENNLDIAVSNTPSERGDCFVVRSIPGGWGQRDV